MFNFVSKKTLKKNIEIQMNNNKVLRDMLRTEQQSNKAYSIENATLKDLLSEEKRKVASLKRQVRTTYEKNKDLYEMLEELKKSNIDIDKLIKNKKLEIRKSKEERPKRKYTRRVKKDGEQQ